MKIECKCIIKSIMLIINYKIIFYFTTIYFFFLNLLTIYTKNKYFKNQYKFILDSGK